MARPDEGITAHTPTPALVLADYEAVVAHATDVPRRREVFQKRTGSFGPEDPWFETRTRAFWDDALTTQRLALSGGPALDDAVRVRVSRWHRAHRGLFLVRSLSAEGAHLVDRWSGAELLVTVLDEAQATSLRHAEGLVDARVVASTVRRAASPRPALFMLPGALHHAPDAREPIEAVLTAARAGAMETGDVLDALLRMEHVMRSSSRVKTSFAYRVESLRSARV